MPHDWMASANRLIQTFAGSKKVDKVPYFPIVDEQMITRVMGITVKELYSSPKRYANALIATNLFFRSDIFPIPTAYAGPAEAHAFAEKNDRLDTIIWYDYKSMSIKQGEVCNTMEDIDKLEIPDHSKSELWTISYETAKIVRDKIRIPQNFGLGVWSVVQQLRGIQAYKDIRRNPDLLLKLCEKVFQSQLDAYENWIEKVGQVSFIFYTGYAFNKHMMSYQDAMKYEGQFIKRLQEKIKVPFILHNCGTKPYWNICEDINFIAVNGSHPLDIKFWIEFREKFPKITIMGANIDVNREMLTGSPQDVEDKVKENIFNLAPKGRYIVSPICCLPWGVSIPNALTIPNTIDKYGHYPIKI